MERCFLSGDSYHPASVFKAIVTGESKRLRSLNSTDMGYSEALDALAKKCKPGRARRTILNYLESAPGAQAYVIQS